jgi:hypothetical protein
LQQIVGEATMKLANEDIVQALLEIDKIEIHVDETTSKVVKFINKT